MAFESNQMHLNQMHLNQMQVQMQMSTIQMQVQMQMRPPRGIQMQVQMQMPHLHLQVQMHLNLNTSLLLTCYLLPLTPMLQCTKCRHISPCCNALSHFYSHWIVFFSNREIDTMQQRSEQGDRAGLPSG